MEIEEYLKRLFPISRSITGEGNRQTLNILKEIIPLNIKEYASGTRVFDWTIPREWNIKDAWIKNSKGEKVVDFQKSNIHIVSYSIPIRTRMKCGELIKHLYYFEEQPEVIPYRTSYYKEHWGFCVSYTDYQKLFCDPEEEFEICIDSELRNGSLTIGELLIKGRSKKEILISTYICHPSMANDNLSGVILTALLARDLQNRKTNCSYRILFIPETIGAITYCAFHKEEMQSIDSGLIVTCVAGPGAFGYKKTFLGNHELDRAIGVILRDNQIPHHIYSFEPQGSDERQYSSPGFRIPVASIHKDKYHEFPYYHTSKDDLSFISTEYLLKSLEIYTKVLNLIDNNAVLKSRNPFCEPQLGKRGLYPSLGRRTLSYSWLQNSSDKRFSPKHDELDAIMNILFWADGHTRLLDVAEKTGIPAEMLIEAVNKLVEHELLEIEI